MADPRLRHKLVPLHDGGHRQSCSPAAESNEGPKLTSSSWGPSQPLPDTSNRRCPRVESFAMSTGLNRLLVDVPVLSPDPDVSGVRKLMERQGP